MKLSQSLINSYSTETFLKKSLEIFHFQAEHNPVYRAYLKAIRCKVDKIDTLEKIPFLPISFFKNHKIVTGNYPEKLVFHSSGTTQTNRSRHYITHPELYNESFTQGFNYCFGAIENYTLLALLPSYLEQQHSSLVYMVKGFMEKSNQPENGFYLHNYQELIHKIETLEHRKQPTLLIGVSYALLDLIELKTFQLKTTKVLETGGMKGRRQEMIKSELHKILQAGFGVKNIYSEYGMTELLSQAYSVENQLFNTPPWMKILIREVEDPFQYVPNGKTGGINVIDLANHYSCSFIETQDLGKMYPDGSFEVLGRFDHSDIRGCNLLMDS